MMTEILQYLRNWFIRDMYVGKFAITDGTITLDGEPLTLADGQYFRVTGSALNDGAWKYPADLRDEEFSGSVAALGVPPAVEALCQEAEEWQSKYGAAAATPWQSESYSRGAYSRSKDSGNGGGTMNALSVIKDRLAPWRRI